MRSRSPWLGLALVLATLYAVVGIVFALPTHHARAWRLAAWAISGAAFALHVAHERLRMHRSNVTAALHAALAAALGALGLAAGAIVHSLSVGSTAQHRRLLLIALLVWPVITGIPAFLVGLVTSAMLGRMSPDTRHD